MRKKHIMAYMVMCSFICILRFLYIKAVSYNNQTYGKQPLVTCTPDRALSKQATEKIKKIAHIHSYRAKNIANDLYTAMPLIKNFAIHNPGNDQYTIHLTTHKPFCTITTPNSWYMVTKNGTYSKNYFFDTQKQEDIAHVIVITKKEIDIPTCIQHLQKYDQKILHTIAQDFVLNWNKKTQIIYTHKNKNFCIVCTWDQKLTPEKIETIRSCAQKIPKLTKNWQADIRFKDQIIFSKIRKPLLSHTLVARGDR